MKDTGKDYPPGFPCLPDLDGRYAVEYDEAAQLWRAACEGQDRGPYMPTEDGAVWAARRHAEVDAAAALIEDAVGGGGIYTRDQYEDACAAVGLTPAPDDSLGTYGDKYGDFWMSHYGAVDIVTAELRRRRIAGIKDERAALAASAPPVKQPTKTIIGSCARCGGDVSAGSGMWASLGLACGDECYDALSG